MDNEIVALQNREIEYVRTLHYAAEMIALCVEEMHDVCPHASETLCGEAMALVNRINATLSRPVVSRAGA